MPKTEHGTGNSMSAYTWYVAPLILAIVMMGATGLSPAQAQEQNKKQVTPSTTTAPEQPDSSTGAPRFRCDETSHTFPECWAGSRVKHTFIIHNDGNAPLKILKVKPSCGCTVTNNYDKVIAPGQQGQLPFTFSPGRREGKTSKNIYVTTNDPAHQRVTLALKANVKSYVSVQPPVATNWKTTSATPNLTKSFTITNNTKSPLKLEEVPQKIKSGFTRSLKEIEPGKAYELTVTAGGPFTREYNYTNLRYNTGIAQQPQVSISCSLHKVPAVALSTTRLRIGHNTSSECKYDITASFNQEGLLKILSAQCNDPRIKTKITEQKPGKEFRISIVIPAGFEFAKDKPTAVTFITDYKSKPDYTVQILPPLTPRSSRRLPSQTQTGPIIGRPAPKTTVKSPQGTPIPVINPGQITLLCFWASWSEASQDQLVMLRKLIPVYKRKQVQFLNINVDQLTPLQDILQAAERLDIKHLPIGLDPNKQTASRYKVSSVPTLVLVSKKGIVEAVFRGTGRNPEHSTKIEQRLRQLLDLVLEGKTYKEFPPARIRPGHVESITKLSTVDHSQRSSMLRVESLRQHCGLQPPGQQIVYPIYCRNMGTNPLELKTVTTAPAVKIEPGYEKTIAPGATTAIRCKFTTPTEPVTFLHRVTITSSDAIRPELSIILAGKSRPHIDVSPTTGVDFSDNPQTHNIPRIATLTYNGQGTIEYGTPTSSSPKFEAELKKSGSPMHTMVIVKSKPPFDPGKNTGAIRIKTTCPQQPVVEVSATLFVPERVEIEPHKPSS